MHFEKFIKFLKQSNRVRRKNSIGLSFLLIVVQRWSKLKLVNSYPFSIFPKNLHFPYKTVAFSLNYSIINLVVCIEILNSRFIFIFTNNLQKGAIYEHRTESKGAPYCEKSYPGRTCRPE